MCEPAYGVNLNMKSCQSYRLFYVSNTEQNDPPLLDAVHVPPLHTGRQPATHSTEISILAKPTTPSVVASDMPESIPS